MSKVPPKILITGFPNRGKGFLTYCLWEAGHDIGRTILAPTTHSSPENIRAPHTEIMWTPMANNLYSPEGLKTLVFPEVVKAPTIPIAALDVIQPELIVVCDHYNKTNRPTEEAEYVTSVLGWAGETNTPLLVPTFPWFIRSVKIGWAQLGSLFGDYDTFEAAHRYANSYTHPTVQKYGQVELAGLQNPEDVL